MEKYGCYNKRKKKRFSISFSFSYLSLFVDTPGLSGQQSRGSPCPEARQPVRAQLVCNRYSSWVSLGIVLTETRKIPAGGNYINELRNNENKLEASTICPTIFPLKNIA